jgi:hypothetical protein
VAGGNVRKAGVYNMRADLSLQEAADILLGSEQCQRNHLRIPCENADVDAANLFQ